MTRILLLTFLVAGTASAQQDPLSTFFRDTYAQFNPANYGTDYKHKAAAVYRNQWDKVNGAPNTLFVNYGMRLGEHHGLGIDYMYDVIGFTQSHTAHLNYNYQLQFADDHKLSLGVGAGILNQSLNPTWVPPTTIIDPTLPQAWRETVPDINFGIQYNLKGFSAGLSSTHIVPFKIESSSGAAYEVARHYYLYISQLFNVGDDFQIQPRFLVRTDAVKLSAEAQLQVTYNKKYWAGTGYRYSDAVSVFLGWDIQERYRVGYAYDITLSKLNNVSRGSHEITLGYLLK